MPGMKVRRYKLWWSGKGDSWWCESNGEGGAVWKGGESKEGK